MIDYHDFYDDERKTKQPAHAHFISYQVLITRKSFVYLPKHQPIERETPTVIMAIFLLVTRISVSNSTRDSREAHRCNEW